MLTDLRFALRILLKRPGFSVFAIITLALGIGANSAIFGLVNGVLLKQLRYHTAEQMVSIWSTREDVSPRVFSIPNFIETSDQARTIDKLKVSIAVLLSPLPCWRVICPRVAPPRSIVALRHE